MMPFVASLTHLQNVARWEGLSRVKSVHNDTPIPGLRIEVYVNKSHQAGFGVLTDGRKTYRLRSFRSNRVIGALVKHFTHRSHRKAGVASPAVNATIFAIRAQILIDLAKMLNVPMNERIDSMDQREGKRIVAMATAKCSENYLSQQSGHSHVTVFPRDGLVLICTQHPSDMLFEWESISTYKVLHGVNPKDTAYKPLPK